MAYARGIASMDQRPISTRCLPPFSRAKLRNVHPSGGDKQGSYEYINTYPEPASGHQILCACQIRFSDLTSSSNRLAQRELEVSPHACLSGCWLWQDDLASELVSIV